MLRRIFVSWVVLCGYFVLAVPQGRAEPSPTTAPTPAGLDVPVTAEWKGELFQRSGQDLLADYKQGDTLVAVGRVEDEQPRALLFYGQQGQLALPIDLPTALAGSLLKVRCRVKLDGDQKRLEPLETLDRLDTHDLLVKAALDYRALLPQIRVKTAMEGSRLKLKETPDTPLGALPSVEGWNVVYVTLRQSDLMYVCDVALRYEKVGKEYILTRCWAAQWFKGE